MTWDSSLAMKMSSTKMLSKCYIAKVPKFLKLTSITNIIRMLNLLSNLRTIRNLNLLSNHRKSLTKILIFMDAKTILQIKQIEVSQRRLRVYMPHSLTFLILFSHLAWHLMSETQAFLQNLINSKINISILKFVKLMKHLMIVLIFLKELEP